jgi:hypothetical protein
MHRIDTAGNDDGLFVDGNPQAGQQGTILDAAWANGVQENLCRAVEAAGIELVKGDHDQLTAAIQAMISTTFALALPVGMRVEFLGPIPETGFMAPDGAQHLRADFPELVAYWSAAGLLIAGDTPDHFKAPLYEGYFSRATSTDATIDPEGPRAAGDIQADAFKSHNHQVQPPASTDDTSAGATTTGTGGAETITPYNTASAGGAETRPKNVAHNWAYVAR